VKNKLLKNIIAIVLAQIVLFSTTSFVLDLHLCNNHVHSFSFFGKASPCNMVSCQVTPNHDQAISVTPCCSDKQIKSEVKEIYKSKELVLLKINFTLNFVPQQNEFKIIKLILRKDYFKDNPPPLQTFNLNELYQVYRI
jgi:hypothetical protein